MKTLMLMKPQIKDLVFDRKQKVEGLVTYIDYPTKNVKIEVLLDYDKDSKTRTTKLVDCQLYNLIVLEKAHRKEFDKNRQYTLVKEFHEAFSHPVTYKPTAIDADRGLSRTVWTGEELVEFLHACSRNKEEFEHLYQGFLEGLGKAYLKSLKEDFIQDETERIVAQVDALTDSSYFLNGTFVELGVQPQKHFEIVHRSNMSKLFTDDSGKKYAKYREDGKILKSPQFFAPEKKLKEEVLRQAKA